MNIIIFISCFRFNHVVIICSRSTAGGVLPCECVKLLPAVNQNPISPIFPLSPWHAKHSIVFCLPCSLSLLCDLLHQISLSWLHQREREEKRKWRLSRFTNSHNASLATLGVPINLVIITLLFSVILIFYSFLSFFDSNLI